MFFFSWRRIDFVVLTRKSAVAILQSDVRWHTRTFRFRPLSPLKFLFPLSDIILLIHSDLLWVEYRWKRPVYYLCYPIQGLHDVFGVPAESVCVGRSRLKLLVSSPAKGAPFLSKLFLTRKIEKVEVWSRFGIVFVHGNGTIPQFHQFFFQNKRLCCVFIPLSLVLML